MNGGYIGNAIYVPAYWMCSRCYRRYNTKEEAENCGNVCNMNKPITAYETKTVSK